LGRRHLERVVQRQIEADDNLAPVAAAWFKLEPKLADRPIAMDFGTFSLALRRQFEKSNSKSGG
jgi:hypothetical protein